MIYDWKLLQHLRRSAMQKARWIQDNPSQFFLEAYKMCKSEGINLAYDDYLSRWSNKDKDKVEVVTRNQSKHYNDRECVLKALKKYSPEKFTQNREDELNFIKQWFYKRDQDNYVELRIEEHNESPEEEIINILPNIKSLDYWKIVNQLLDTRAEKIKEEPVFTEEDFYSDEEVKQMYNKILQKGQFQDGFSSKVLAELRNRKLPYKPDNNNKRWWLMNHKFIWDVAMEIAETFNFTPRKTEEQRREYQRKYYQETKDYRKRLREKRGYNPEVKEQWKNASFRYKNKVCFYNDHYYYFEQLKRKLKSSEEARKYLLAESDQVRKCFYEGQEYEFWLLCYELRKTSENPYRVALQAIVK